MGGYQMKEVHEPNKTSTKRRNLAELTPEERHLIEALEKLKGRELTQQEVNLSLDQARHIGQL